MSTSFTPSKDLILQAKVPQVPSLFTTFSRSHFVKPGQFSQPVKPTAPVAVKTASFAGCYTEVYAAAPIDLEFDEPNAVTQCEVEIVQAGSGISQIEISVPTETKTRLTQARQQSTQRAAA